MPVRRASRNITLVLIGSAASLAACSPGGEPTYQRDHYLSVDDCAADWGRPEACEPTPGNALAGSSDTTARGGSYYFRGPMYSRGYRNDAQSASRETARAEGLPAQSLTPSDRSVARSSPAASGVRSSSARRGGFGSTSRSYSSGG